MDKGNRDRLANVIDEFDTAEAERKAKEPKPDPTPEKQIEPQVVPDPFFELQAPDPNAGLKNLDWRDLKAYDLIEERKGDFVCWRPMVCANGSSTSPAPYAVVCWAGMDAHTAQPDLRGRAIDDFGSYFKDEWDAELPLWMARELKSFSEEQEMGDNVRNWSVYLARMDDGFGYAGFTSQAPKDRVAQLGTDQGPRICRGKGKATLLWAKPIWSLDAGSVFSHYVRCMSQYKAITMTMIETWYKRVMDLNEGDLPDDRMGNMY